MGGIMRSVDGGEPRFRCVVQPWFSFTARSIALSVALWQTRRCPYGPGHTGGGLLWCTLEVFACNGPSNLPNSLHEVHVSVCAQDAGVVLCVRACVRACVWRCRAVWHVYVRARVRVLVCACVCPLRVMLLGNEWTDPRQGSIRMAVYHRRRGGTSHWTPPPPQKTKVTKGGGHTFWLCMLLLA